MRKPLTQVILEQEECLKYNKKSGVFHVFMLYKFKELVDINHCILYKDAQTILHRHTVPKHISYQFLKEMEQFKLIKIKNKQKIRLLR